MKTEQPERTLTAAATELLRAAIALRAQTPPTKEERALVLGNHDAALNAFRDAFRVQVAKVDEIVHHDFLSREEMRDELKKFGPDASILLASFLSKLDKSNSNPRIVNEGWELLAGFDMGMFLRLALTGSCGLASHEERVQFFKDFTEQSTGHLGWSSSSHRSWSLAGVLNGLFHSSEKVRTLCEEIYAQTLSEECAPDKLFAHSIWGEPIQVNWGIDGKQVHDSTIVKLMESSQLHLQALGLRVLESKIFYDVYDPVAMPETVATAAKALLQSPSSAIARKAWSIAVTMEVLQPNGAKVCLVSGKLAESILEHGQAAKMGFLDAVCGSVLEAELYGKDQSPDHNSTWGRILKGLCNDSDPQIALRAASEALYCRSLNDLGLGALQRMAHAPMDVSCLRPLLVCVRSLNYCMDDTPKLKRSGVQIVLGKDPTPWERMNAALKVTLPRAEELFQALLEKEAPSDSLLLDMIGVLPRSAALHGALLARLEGAPAERRHEVSCPLYEILPIAVVSDQRIVNAIFERLVEVGANPASRSVAVTAAIFLAAQGEVTADNADRISRQLADFDDRGLNWNSSKPLCKGLLRFAKFSGRFMENAIDALTIQELHPDEHPFVRDFLHALGAPVVEVLKRELAVSSEDSAWKSKAQLRAKRLHVLLGLAQAESAS